MFKTAKQNTINNDIIRLKFLIINIRLIELGIKRLFKYSMFVLIDHDKELNKLSVFSIIEQ